MGLEKVKFFYFEPEFKTEFFRAERGGGGGGLEQVNFFTENPIFFFWGGGGGDGVEDGGWGLVDGQTNRPKPSSVTLAFNLGNKNVLSFFSKAATLQNYFEIHA